MPRCRLAALALLLAGCAREAAPGVYVGAEVRVRGVDGLPPSVYHRVNDVEGTRARIGEVWVDFAKVTSYEALPRK